MPDKIGLNGVMIKLHDDTSNTPLSLNHKETSKLAKAKY